jgi:23S rRNA pseudouridine1911/1915/1917 synthase
LIRDPDAGAHFTQTVPPDQAGQRLDKWLSLQLTDRSRAFWQRLIETGMVRQQPNDLPLTNPSYKLKGGEVVVVTMPPPAADAIALPPTPRLLDIVFEDEALVVVNKPAGLVTHPGAGHHEATLVQALLAHTNGQLASTGAPLRPGIVHRLDKGTSGVMVVAKTDTAHHHLAKQFAAHSIEREYQAIVWGTPTPPAGTIRGAIGRSDHNRQKMALVLGRGKPAVTHYQVLQDLPGPTALVRCRLETGRTHQIRVHLTSLGHPLVGDSTYGGGGRKSASALPVPLQGALNGLGRPALHAAVLGFIHPTTNQLLRFDAPMPEDLAKLLKLLENR